MTTKDAPPSVTRRDFMASSAVAAVGSLAAARLTVAQSAYGAGSDSIRVGLIGCGGRGTGAAHNALEASQRPTSSAIVSTAAGSVWRRTTTVAGWPRGGAI